MNSKYITEKNKLLNNFNPFKSSNSLQSAISDCKTLSSTKLNKPGQYYSEEQIRKLKNTIKNLTKLMKSFNVTKEPLLAQKDTQKAKAQSIKYYQAAPLLSVTPNDPLNKYVIVDTASEKKHDEKNIDKIILKPINNNNNTKNIEKQKKKQQEIDEMFNSAATELLGNNINNNNINNIISSYDDNDDDDAIDVKHYNPSIIPMNNNNNTIVNYNLCTMCNHLHEDHIMNKCLSYNCYCKGYVYEPEFDINKMDFLTGDVIIEEHHDDHNQQEGIPNNPLPPISSNSINNDINIMNYSGENIQIFNFLQQCFPNDSTLCHSIYNEFVKHTMTMETIMELDHDILKNEFNIQLFGHRMKILKQIQLLGLYPS